jgi:hypothetical protein
MNQNLIFHLSNLFGVEKTSEIIDNALSKIKDDFGCNTNCKLKSFTSDTVNGLYKINFHVTVNEKNEEFSYYFK